MRSGTVIQEGALLVRSTVVGVVQPCPNSPSSCMACVCSILASSIKGCVTPSLRMAPQLAPQTCTTVACGGAVGPHIVWYVRRALRPACSQLLQLVPSSLCAMPPRTAGRQHVLRCGRRAPGTVRRGPGAGGEGAVPHHPASRTRCVRATLKVLGWVPSSTLSVRARDCNACSAQM